MPSYRLRLFVVLAVLVLCVAACRKKTTKEEYLASGNAFATSGKHAEAVVQYRNAIALDAKYGDAHLKLAEAYVKTSELPKAMGEYIRAADLLPANVEANLQATKFLLLARRFEDAKARAELVLAREPKNLDAQIAKATALAGLKDPKAAIEEVDEAIKMNPSDARSYLMRGALQVGQHRLEEAEAAFKTAVEVNPKSLQAQQAIAAFYWSSNRLPEAEVWLRKAVEGEPADLSVQRALATFLVSTGRPKEAEAPLKAIAESTKTAAARLALADYYLWQGRVAEARPVLEDTAKLTDGFAPAKVRLAQIDRARQAPAAAYGSLADVLVKAPKNVDALVLRARFEVADKKNDEALATAQAAVEAGPTSAPAQDVLGDAQSVRGDTDLAIRAYNEALRLNTRLIGTKLKMAQLQLKKGDANLAVQISEEALQAAPTSVPVRLMHARALTARGDLARAEEALTSVMKGTPNFAPAHTQMAEVMLAKKDLVGARREFTRALELDPNSLEALRGKVFVDLADKKGAQARATMDQQLAKNPSSPEILLLASGVYAATGDAAKQEAALNKVVEVDPNNMQAFLSLATLYVRQGKLDEAKKKYEALSARGSTARAGKTMVALILEAQGKTKEARAAYEELVSADPEAGVAANNLAWLYAEQGGGNLDQALTLAQTAKRKLPGSAEVNDTLGWVFYKKDLPGQAVTAFEDAIKMDPKSPQYHYHLGLAHSKNGNRLKAREALDAALKLKPDFKEALEARAKN